MSRRSNAVDDAINVIALDIEASRIVPGRGGREPSLVLGFREYVDGVEGREQLALPAVADGLEAVPRSPACSGRLNRSTPWWTCAANEQEARS